MSDTIERECKCCETEGDCIEGLCLSCSTFGYEQEKKIDLLTLGLLQEKNKVDALLSTINNALISLTIMSLPQLDETVASDEEVLKIVVDSFKAVIKEVAKGA